jgi:hypothetical protein
MPEFDSEIIPFLNENSTIDELDKEAKKRINAKKRKLIIDESIELDAQEMRHQLQNHSDIQELVFIF